MAPGTTEETFLELEGEPMVMIDKKTITSLHEVKNVMCFNLQTFQIMVEPGLVKPLSCVKEIAANKSKMDDNSAFVMLDLDQVVNLYNLWQNELPSIMVNKYVLKNMLQPYYAVKCNTDERLLRLLAALGAGFDCASQSEIDMVGEK